MNIRSWSIVAGTQSQTQPKVVFVNTLQQIQLSQQMKKVNFFIWFSISSPSNHGDSLIADIHAHTAQHKYNWVWSYHSFMRMLGMNISSFAFRQIKRVRHEMRRHQQHNTRQQQQQRWRRKNNVVETTTRQNRLNHVNGRVMFMGFGKLKRPSTTR